MSTATDVAKSAAGIVLTKPGLGGIVASIKEGRVTFQRILTYTLNSVTKKVVQVLFLAVGLVMTGHAILTSMLIVIIMLTGDLLGMSLTTDNAPVSNSQCLANQPIDDRRCLHGICELVFLHRDLDDRQIPPGFRNRRAANSELRGDRIWQSSDDIYESRTSASGVLSSQPVARCIIYSRSADCLNARDFWNRNDRLPILLVAEMLAAGVLFAVIADFAKVPCSNASGSRSLWDLVNRGKRLHLDIGRTLFLDVGARAPDQGGPDLYTRKLRCGEFPACIRSAG